MRGDICGVAGLLASWRGVEELRNFPLFFHYLNLIPETEHEAITDIYLPLK